MFTKSKFACIEPEITKINGKESAHDDIKTLKAKNDENKDSPIIEKENAIQDEDKILLLPIKYFSKTDDICLDKGLFALNYWFNVPENDFQKVLELTKSMMYASLMVDDVYDDTKIRNKAPAAHKIYGTPSTVNAAIYTYCIVLKESIAMGKPEALNIFSNLLLEMHRGQGMEVYWRDNYICPTEAQYKRMAIQKTGCAFFALVDLLKLYSDNKTDFDFNKLFELIALYVQIHNDYCNLKNQEYMETVKDYCEDITEGKFSFPIVHAIQSNPDDDIILKILKKRTSDVELKKYCISLMESYGSFDYTLQVLKELKEGVSKELEDRGGNPYLELIVDIYSTQTMKDEPRK